MRPFSILVAAVVWLFATFSLGQITLDGPDTAPVNQPVVLGIGGLPAIDLEAPLKNQLAWAEKLHVELLAPGSAPDTASSRAPLHWEAVIKLTKGTFQFVGSTQFVPTQPGTYWVVLWQDTLPVQIVAAQVDVSGDGVNPRPDPKPDPPKPDPQPEPSPENPYAVPDAAYREIVAPVLNLQDDIPTDEAEAAAAMYDAAAGYIAAQTGDVTNQELRQFLEDQPPPFQDAPKSMAAALDAILVKQFKLDVQVRINKDPAINVLRALAWALWERGHKQ